ncbi:hypothetical protein MLD38_038274 [Melastoma candidum]|uniref:Uncharacterized protein n=1 Tax=Melastoma candidum TaxID=119954 RepID=A0ACB9KYF2_9MYRT|nr:hypothetical protein MLD38_038274 [Melastoma candidum]
MLQWELGRPFARAPRERDNHQAARDLGNHPRAVMHADRRRHLEGHGHKYGGHWYDVAILLAWGVLYRFFFDLVLRFYSKNVKVKNSESTPLVGITNLVQHFYDCYDGSVLKGETEQNMLCSYICI